MKCLITDRGFTTLSLCTMTIYLYIHRASHDTAGLEICPNEVSLERDNIAWERFCHCQSMRGR